MVQLHQDIEQLAAANLQVVGVSYDSVPILQSFTEKQEIQFPLLSDEGSATIHEYKVHYKDGLPHPGTIVVDKTGVIRGKIFRDGYRDRHPTDELIELANSIGL